ncbi:TetR/AcrR family transcriptional regulator [Pseudonocardia sp.]|uniref:TetR/AcrR family transcriptional regulator n=1 Tax=Pseudonocardia sp. TaxID=60912 RepID=UPI00262AD14E|nr:TetR/AcrR family transcriptional regulator [Pseudonocardia sp.]
MSRTRDSAATRRALLAAARELFAAQGYEGTTVRAVADRAGVNQALLFRYFGNKEALFAEAATELALAPLRAGPPETLLERILTALLDDSPGAGMFFAVLRSGGRPAEAVREQLGAAYSEAFASLAGTDDPADAAVRADLLLAWLLGIAQLRSVLRAGPLLHADDAAVTAHVLRAARSLLAGPAAREPGLSR